MQPNYYQTPVLRQSVIPIQKTVDKCVWVQTVLLKTCYQEKSLIWVFCVSEGICQQDTQCTYTRNIGSISRNHSRRGKAISITCSDTVSVALGIQHAMHMTLFYSHLWSGRLYLIFQHYLKQHYFRGKKLLNIKYVFWFSLENCIKHFSFYEEWVEIFHKSASVSV